MRAIHAHFFCEPNGSSRFIGLVRGTGLGKTPVSTMGLGHSRVGLDVDMQAPERVALSPLFP
jgi:hypothetical protein